jgi:hypothetical protein
LYAQLPIVMVCEHIEQHTHNNNNSKGGDFTGTIDIGLYTKKKQHKQQHKVEAKLPGEQFDIYSKQIKLYWVI